MLIHADKNQLSQVIINLIINAIDAMEREWNSYVTDIPERRRP